MGLTALLAACGNNDGEDDAGDDKGGGKSGRFTFKDDRGKTVALDQHPDTVVAYVSTAAALHDYGIQCKAIFGPSKPVAGKPNPQAGDLDLDKVTSLGEEWGQFNVEKYASLEPDVLISNMFPPPKLWSVPDDSSKKIYALAPSIGIKGSNTTLLDPLRRYEELATALGADLKAKKVTDAKARFKRAEQRLRAAAKAAKGRGGVRVLALTGDDDNMYVAVPDAYCDLHYFRDLGVDVVRGKKSDKWGFWEFLSWENADKYDADLILLDNRTQSLPLADLKKKPTFARLPAVEAGRITPWAMEERYSYAGFAPVLERLADAIQEAGSPG